MRRALLAVAVLVVGCGRSQPEPPKPAPVAAPAPAAPKAGSGPQSLCPREEGTTKVVTYGAFEVTVNRVEVCAVSVKANGRLLASDETGIGVDVERADLDNDGSPELLVVADSGGSGGHANNYVFTSKPQPRLVETFDGCASKTVPAPGGRRAVVTCELGMNMMDGVCNGCSPRPNIYYMLDNGKLAVRNDLFVDAYDRIIKDELARLKQEDVDNFLTTKSDSERDYFESPARAQLMRIAAEYIYSSREAQAKALIDKSWPAFDRERILNDLKSHAQR